jgi:hypothetical protein
MGCKIPCGTGYQTPLHIPQQGRFWLFSLMGLSKRRLSPESAHTAPKWHWFTKGALCQNQPVGNQQSLGSPSKALKAYPDGSF